MTVQEAIENANKMKAGNAVPDEMKIAWLNELEATIYEDLILKHIHDIHTSKWWHFNPQTHRFEFLPAPIYYPGEDDDVELIAESPYDQIYVYWLMAKIDLFAQENNKYVNDIALFENQYSRFKSAYHQRHRSVPTPHIRVGVFR